MNSLKYILFAIPVVALLSFLNPDSKKPTKTEGTELVWLNDIEEAHKISEKTKRPIMANFTGSDWCGWCHKLSGEVFNTPEFKKWSDKNVVLLELDFPKKKEQPEKLKNQNNGLMQFFQVQGFPTIWLFDMKKDEATQKFTINPIGKTGYVKGGPQAFIDGLEQMIKVQKEKKAEEKKALKPAKATHD
jgi:thioredoxin-related protein